MHLFLIKYTLNKQCIILDYLSATRKSEFMEFLLVQFHLFLTLHKERKGGSMDQETVDYNIDGDHIRKAAR